MLYVPYDPDDSGAARATLRVASALVPIRLGDLDAVIVIVVTAASCPETVEEQILVCPSPTTEVEDPNAYREERRGLPRAAAAG